MVVTIVFTLLFVRYGTEPCIPNYSTESRPTLKQAREEACSSSAVLPGKYVTYNNYVMYRCVCSLLSKTYVIRVGKHGI